MHRDMHQARDKLPWLQTFRQASESAVYWRERSASTRLRNGSLRPSLLRDRVVQTSGDAFIHASNI